MSNIKLTILSILLVSVLAVTGCGGGGGDGTTSPESPSSPHSPAISNLQYSPTKINWDLGPQTINGTIDFSDSDGDVEFLRITDSDGGDTTIQLLNITGKTTGSIQVSASITPNGAKTFSFTVWLLDSAGHSSNQLVGSVSINPGTLSQDGTYSNTINSLTVHVPSSDLTNCVSMFDSGDFTISNVQYHTTYTCIATSFDLTDPVNRQMSCGLQVFNPSLCGGGPSSDYSGSWTCNDQNSSNTYSIDLASSSNIASIIGTIYGCDKP